jgi:hypothetical protein
MKKPKQNDEDYVAKKNHECLMTITSTNLRIFKTVSTACVDVIRGKIQEASEYKAIFTSHAIYSIERHDFCLGFSN